MIHLHDFKRQEEEISVISGDGYAKLSGVNGNIFLENYDITTFGKTTGEWIQVARTGTWEITVPLTPIGRLILDS